MTDVTALRGVMARVVKVRVSKFKYCVLKKEMYKKKCTIYRVAQLIHYTKQLRKELKLKINIYLN